MIDNASEKIRLLDYKNGFVTIEQISSIITESCKELQAKVAKGEELALHIRERHYHHHPSNKFEDCHVPICKLAREVLGEK